MGPHYRSTRTSVSALPGPARASFGENKGDTPEPTVKKLYVGPARRVARPYTEAQPRTKYAIVSRDDGTSLSIDSDVGLSLAGAGTSVVRRTYLVYNCHFANKRNGKWGA
jgi:hypothetical protein